MSDQRHEQLAALGAEWATALIPTLAGTCSTDNSPWPDTLTRHR
ncbi:hypothetical protein ACH4EC_34135 [Streptomyces anulatus]